MAKPAADRSAAIRHGTPIESSEDRISGGRTPEDGRIDWSRPAADIYNLIRAVAPPYPGAFSEINGVRVTVARARRRAATDPDQVVVGGGLAVREGRIVGICGDGGVIDMLELWQGRRLMRAGDLSHLLARLASIGS